MEHVFANKTVGISELKLNPAAVLLAAQTEPVAILNRNKPAGYLLNPQAWQAMFKKLDDAELVATALARLSDASKAVKVKLDAAVAGQFKKKLAQRLLQPRVPSAAVSGAPDLYKIKLRTVGFRLVYRVQNQPLTVLVSSVGTR